MGTGACGEITREGMGCNSITKEDLEIKMSRLLSWICMLPLTYQGKNLNCCLPICNFREKKKKNFKVSKHSLRSAPSKCESVNHS